MKWSLKQKRADFFAKALKQINKQDTGETLPQDTGTGQKPGSSLEGAEPEKEVVMIRCPKCGKSVDRSRVVKKKYVGGFDRTFDGTRI